MASNNTSAVICSKPDWFWRFREQLEFVCYQVVLPIHVAVNLLLHPLFLYAVLKQAKTAKGYMYQAYLSIFELSDVIVHAFHYKVLQWSGIDGRSEEWYSSSYPLMFFAAHISIPFSESVLIMILLAALSMAADRVLGLAKPYAYASMNHTKRQGIAMGCTVLIGFISTFHNAFLFQAVEEYQGRYRMVPNYSFLSSTVSKVFGFACIFIRLIGIFCLVGFNVAILRLYRKHVSKGKNLFKKATQSNQIDVQKERMEQALMRLTVTQSVFTSFAVLVQIMFWTAVFTMPTFNLCESTICVPLMNTVYMLCNMADIACDMTINPMTRDSVKALLKRIPKCRSK